MSTKNKIILSTVIVTAAGALAYWFSILGSEIALFERFPDIDPKIVVKAHRKFIRETLKGTYKDRVIVTDEDHDKVFLEIVEALTTK